MNTERETDDDRTTKRTGEPSSDATGRDVRERVLPDRIGGFALEEEIGRGGVGLVYRARNLVDGSLAAVKIVGTSLVGGDGDDSLRLVREALALRRLNHENVVKVYDAGQHGDLVYLAMELIDGQTLKAWQSDPQRTLADIVTQYGRVGLGLAAAHDAGLVHRDFKPGNVMVDRQNRPCILDFGLARQTPLSTGKHLDDDPWEEITQVGVTVGTPGYMAPEQIRGDPPDAKADQFSFCIAVYEALMREHPFEGTDGKGIMSSITNDRRRKQGEDPAFPPALRDLLDRGLSANPADRFESMSELVVELAGVRMTRPETAPPNRLVDPVVSTAVE